MNGPSWMDFAARGALTADVVHTVADGQLITGQNPACSGPAARLLLEMLGKRVN